VAALAQRGRRAHAVELPNNEPELGSADYAELIRREVGRDEQPVVVAHSGSGVLLPAAARDVGARLQVWLAAWVPAPDVSFNAEIERHAEEAFNPEWIGKDATADAAVAEHFVYHDCDPPTLAWALGTRRRFLPLAAFDERIWLAAEIPSTYILATEDRTIRPDWQRRMARERLGVEPIEIPTGHCPNVSQPELLADVLVGAAAGGRR
jgi:pimeloyl-ACP methyl ester carboxylesterase